MENNAVPSLSDIMTEDSSSEESFPGEDIDADEKSALKIVSDTAVPDVECGNDCRRGDLVLDLRSLHEINCSVKNDEDKYEKLSEVIEEPDDLPTEVAILDESQTLQDRLDALNNVMTTLRGELKTEVSLWRKERDEFQSLRDKCDLLALEEATAAARAAAEAYAAESPLSENLDITQYNFWVNFPGAGEIIDVNPEQTLSELTVLEYEKKLAKYQDALALSQAENRYNMRRQIAANTYRKKLMEVERLCDEELEKIKQNASSLQPLKRMVSQWYTSDRCGGDAAADKSAGPSAVDNCVYKSPPLSFDKDYHWSNFTSFDTKNIDNKIDAEVNMTPEIFGAKFNTDQTGFQLRYDYDKRYNLGSSGNPALSLKWESSDYALSTSPGNP